MMETDFLIVGAGIGGASVAAELSSSASVILLDMEDQAGYHTTGRSAAFYAETYGGPAIQPLTTASKNFFYNQPEGFSDTPVLLRLGAIHVFRADQQQLAQAFFDSFKGAIPNLRWLDTATLYDRVPSLDEGMFIGGIDDPDCGGLDVAVLHQGYLRQAKKAGASLLLGAGLESATYKDSVWHVETRKGTVIAKVIVNAAGAWGDEVAVRSGVKPIGIKPLRRTIITVPNPSGKPYDPACPVVLDVEENWYFKPEGTGYLVSPADETPSAPCDVQPDIEDVALAAYHFGVATGTEVQSIDARWAGLRTFGPDGKPVIGFASDHPAFFWNVGQGGYGIQTAPAWALLASNLLKGEPLGDILVQHGVKAEQYSPARL